MINPGKDSNGILGPHRKRDLPLGNHSTNQHEGVNPARANWIQMLKSFTLIQDIIKETWVSQCRRRLHAD